MLFFGDHHQDRSPEGIHGWRAHCLGCDADQDRTETARNGGRRN